MVRPSFIKGLVDEDMSIKDWLVEILFYNDFACFLRRIGRFILRIGRWIPVLWKQEEWDFAYIYDLLIMKMKELRKSISEDTWHHEDCVKEELEQIDSCLDHLDKYLNWPNYIKVPIASFDRWVDNEDGTKSLEFSEEEHEAYQKANEFEQEHYDAFWDEFVKYHRNWWT